MCLSIWIQKIKKKMNKRESITLARMRQKFDDFDKYNRERLDSIHKDFQEIKEEVKLNSVFRYKAKGIIGAVSFISVVFGAFILWGIDKLSKLKDGLGGV